MGKILYFRLKAVPFKIQSLAIFIILITWEFALGETFYVPSDNYLNIQAAINASIDGDTIIVENGIYRGVGNKDLTFNGKQIILQSMNGPEFTIIDCEHDGRGLYLHNNETALSKFIGFTIRNGNPSTIWGGGIALENCSPIIENCIIENCTIEDGGTYSRTMGGGIIVFGGSPILRKIRVFNNSARFGGGIYANDSTLTLEDSIISENLASFPHYESGYGTINSGSGGGIFVTYGSASISNCIIYANIAEQADLGTVLWDGGGSAIYYSNGALVNIINCTIYGNETGRTGGTLTGNSGTEANVLNTILWANLPNPQVRDYNGSETLINFSDIQGGWTGTGNLDSNPRLISPTQLNFEIDVLSPCIDSGNSDGAPTNDFDDDNRPWGIGFDIGAQEYIGSLEGGLKGFIFDLSSGLPVQNALISTGSEEIYSTSNGYYETLLEPGEYTITVFRDNYQQIQIFNVLIDSSYVTILNIELTPPGPLNIVTTTLPSGEADIEYDSRVRISGGIYPYTYAIASGSLPSGLTIDPANGTISGTPTAIGSTDFWVSVTDSDGAFAAQQFTITVTQPLAIDTTSPLLRATRTQPYSYSIISSGGTLPHSFALSSGSLPAGLSLSSSGLFSGTPTVAGSYDFTIQVTDASDRTAEQSFHLDVDDPLGISTSSLNDGVVGTIFSQTLSATGGYGDYVWRVYTGQLPPGLLLDSMTGDISGTPTRAIYSNIVIEVSDEIGRKITKILSMKVADPLQVLTTSLPDAFVGIEYSEQIRINGGIGPYTFLLTGLLPDGLSFDSSTGVISGIATSGMARNFSVTVQDSTSPTTQSTDPSSFFLWSKTSLTVTTSAILPNAKKDVAISPIVLSAGGGLSPYTWQLVAGYLPVGISLNPSTGELTGIPLDKGDFVFTIQATDTGATTAEKEFFWHISDTLAITTGAVADGAQNDPYSFVLEATGGIKPYTWSIVNGSLPSGLNLNPSTGAIYGTPTTRQSTEFTMRVVDVDSPTQSVEHTYSMNIVDELIVFTPTLPNGRIDEAYTATVSAKLGVPPYSWRVSEGVLPPGLTLAGSATVATLEGTPTTPGQYTFTLEVTDTGTPMGTATREYVVEIYDDVTITTEALPCAVRNQPYAESIVTTGGKIPYTCQLTAGSLPLGLSLNSTSGEISGTTAEVGGFSAEITVRATDAGNPSDYDEQLLTIYVVNPLEITTDTLQDAAKGYAYMAALEGQGGLSPYSWHLHSGTLPTGLELDGATGEITGSPTDCGSYDFTIRIEDAASIANTVTKAFTLSVIAIGDADCDGLLDAVENAYCTDPADADTDDDGILDGVEDANQNGVVDSGETDPCLADTDGDGIQDGTELGLTLSDVGPDTDAGIFVADADPTGTTDPTLADSDSDGVSDGDEDVDRNGRVDSGESDPNQTGDVIEPLEITSASPLPFATRSNSYTFPLLASGGVAPYSFVTTSGTLPTGLTLSGDGILSGTPTVAGDYDFTVQANDPIGRSDEQPFALLVVDPLAITTDVLEDGTLGIAYSQSLSVSGEYGDCEWGIGSGTLPPGISLSAAGTFSGTPSESGVFGFTIQVTDALNRSAQVSLQITVAAATLVITTETLDDGIVDTAYSQILAATGGYGSYSWHLYSGTLPPNLTIDAASGEISGTPVGDSCGSTYEFTIRLEDSSPMPISTYKTFSIGISAINDADCDGLLDDIENASCTYFDDADTDDDGITDGEEDANLNGVVDIGETDPCLTDTDGDGIQDGTERGLTLDDIGPDTDVDVFIPDADPNSTTDPLDDDSDNDGFIDGMEDLNNNGIIDSIESDPNDENSIPNPEIIFDYTFDIENASKWFGGDDGSITGGRNVGVGQSFNLSKDSHINWIGFKFDRRFDYNSYPSGEGQEVTLVLNLRLDNGNIVKTVEAFVPATFTGGWIYFNVDTTINAHTSYIATCYLQDGCLLELNTGVVGDSGSSLDNSIGYSGQINDATGDMENWNNWTYHSWDFCFQIKGYYLNSEPGDDVDSDGLLDDLETFGCTNRNDADTDDDGILDGVEDANQNGVVDAGETNPCLADTDGDGIQDGTERGLTLEEIGADTDPAVFIPDSDPTTTTNPLLSDTDGDGLSDGDEDLNHNGRVDANEGDPNIQDVGDEPKAMPWIPLLLLN